MVGNYLDYSITMKQLMNEAMDMLKFTQYVVCGNFTSPPQVCMTMCQLEIYFFFKLRKKKDSCLGLLYIAMIIHHDQNQ